MISILLKGFKMFIYTVYNITWAGLHMPIEKFKTLKDALQFIKEHQNYSLIIKDNLNNDKIIDIERL